MDFDRQNRPKKYVVEDSQHLINSHSTIYSNPRYNSQKIILRGGGLQFVGDREREFHLMKTPLPPAETQYVYIPHKKNRPFGAQGSLYKKERTDYNGEQKELDPTMYSLTNYNSKDKVFNFETLGKDYKKIGEEQGERLIKRKPTKIVEDANLIYPGQYPVEGLTELPKDRWVFQGLFKGKYGLDEMQSSYKRIKDNVKQDQVYKLVTKGSPPLTRHKFYNTKLKTFVTSDDPLSLKHAPRHMFVHHYYY